MVVWSKIAEADILNLEEYLSERYIIAQKTIDRIISAIEALEDFPRAGRIARVFGTRELVISDTPYLVVYRIADEDIQILSVLHGARRWPKSFNVSQ